MQDDMLVINDNRSDEVWQAVVFLLFFFLGGGGGFTKFKLC